MTSVYSPLFKFTQLAIAMNPESVKYGTAGTKQEFYCKWHEEDVQWQEETAKRYVDDGHITEQDKVIVSMLSKKRLLNIIRFFILYDIKSECSMCGICHFA